MAISTTSLRPQSSDPLVAGLTNGTYWSLGPNRTITWAMADLEGDFFWATPAANKATIASALREFSEIANIRFDYSGYFGDPTYTTANIVFTATFLPPLYGWNGLASAYFPSETMSDARIRNWFGSASIYPNAAGDVWFNASAPEIAYSTHNPGSTYYFALLHEIGHSLGLKHPHDGGGTGRPTFTNLGIDTLDNQLFTIMSYDEATTIAEWFAYFGLPTDVGYPSTLMPLDVVALQSI